MDELFTIREVEANDYFDFDDVSAKKWFTDSKIGEVMNIYNEYLERRFNYVV
jgi:hypothetical protein